jgi:hypothetical protein
VSAKQHYRADLQRTLADEEDNITGSWKKENDSAACCT